MAEDELRMLIHLSMSMVKLEQTMNERLGKLEQTVNVLHNNNATMSALLNDLLEQGRIEVDCSNRLLSAEAQLISLSNSLKSVLWEIEGLKGGTTHAANTQG